MTMIADRPIPGREPWRHPTEALKPGAFCRLGDSDVPDAPGLTGPASIAENQNDGEHHPAEYRPEARKSARKLVQQVIADESTTYLGYVYDRGYPIHHRVIMNHRLTAENEKGNSPGSAGWRDE